MERKITITGNGRIKVTPDYINLTLTVAVNNKKYEKAVDEVEERVNVLAKMLSPNDTSEKSKELARALLNN